MEQTQVAPTETEQPPTLEDVVAEWRKEVEKYRDRTEYWYGQWARNKLELQNANRGLARLSKRNQRMKSQLSYALGRVALLEALVFGKIGTDGKSSSRDCGNQDRPV